MKNSILKISAYSIVLVLFVFFNGNLVNPMDFEYR